MDWVVTNFLLQMLLNFVFAVQDNPTYVQTSKLLMLKSEIIFFKWRH